MEEYLSFGCKIFVYDQFSTHSHLVLVDLTVYTMFYFFVYVYDTYVFSAILALGLAPSCTRCWSRTVLCLLSSAPRLTLYTF